MKRVLRRIRKFNRWDWLLVVVLLWWLLATGALAIIYSTLGQVVAGQFSLLLYAPLIIYMIVSIVIVGWVSPHEPLIPRESMLWNWISSMSRWLNAGLLLVTGAFVGALAGASFGGERSEVSQVAGAGVILLVILEFWIALAILLWAIVAAVDIVRLGKRRVKNYLNWGESRHKKVRNLESKAEVVSGGSSPAAVGVAALGLVASVLLLGQAAVRLVSGAA